MDGKPISLVAKDRLTPEQRLGKTLFYSANSDDFPLTGSNWMSCVSCHSDGEVDTLTLTTAKGPRNVPSNVLAFETGLFMWDGSRDDFDDYIHTIQGEMGGMADVDPGKPIAADKQKIFDAMEAYMRMPDAFPVPESPYRTEDGKLTPEAEQGKNLFEGKAQCIACHAADVMTDSVKAVDSQGKLTTDNTDFLHDVGTVSKTDTDYGGDARGAFKNKRTRGQYDTPTLRGIYATAPYLHDGSAADTRRRPQKRRRQTRSNKQSDLQRTKQLNRLPQANPIKDLVIVCPIRGRQNSTKSKSVSQRDENEDTSGAALERRISNTAKYPGVQRAGAHRGPPPGDLGGALREVSGRNRGNFKIKRVKSKGHPLDISPPGSIIVITTKMGISKRRCKLQRVGGWCKPMQASDAEWIPELR